ncbi:unnamed protein product [Pleuronectes platessa]|uniref:Uncharacterized protein n=1 Tax=Pleuronectes platessa TaxID=8262 RepID=A0A9N7ULW2_PLEPL|nr:unnamed protein product [Pleuronectes platessa]
MGHIRQSREQTRPGCSEIRPPHQTRAIPGDWVHVDGTHLLWHLTGKFYGDLDTSTINKDEYSFVGFALVNRERSEWQCLLCHTERRLDRQSRFFSVGSRQARSREAEFFYTNTSERSSSTGQILETCIIRSSQDAGGKVDLPRLIESTYPSSLSNPQPAAPADRSPMAYLRLNTHTRVLTHPHSGPRDEERGIGVPAATPNKMAFSEVAKVAGRPAELRGLQTPRRTGDGLGNPSRLPVTRLFRGELIRPTWSSLALCQMLAQLATADPSRSPRGPALWAWHPTHTDTGSVGEDFPTDGSLNLQRSHHISMMRTEVTSHVKMISLTHMLKEKEKESTRGDDFSTHLGNFDL